ncbi:MAG TPA: RNA-binding protein, partial [Polyangiaceae bacterium]|nr:RNA-binding protein [Polyangiaceae bacterium]
VAMGNRLYVGNLSFNATTETLRSTFAEYGDVTDVHLVTDRQTGQSRGFGFVTMGSAAAASKAMSQLNGSMLDGRALKVNEAEDRPAAGGGGGGRSNSRGGGGARW